MNVTHAAFDSSTSGITQRSLKALREASYGGISKTSGNSFAVWREITPE